MKQRLTRFFGFIMAFLLTVGSVTMPAFASGATAATGVSANEAYVALLTMLHEPDSYADVLGSVHGNTSADRILSLHGKSYKAKDGGYYLYDELYVGDPNDTSKNPIDESKFSSLTTKGKKDFVTDLLIYGNAIAYANEKNRSATPVLTDANAAITTDTVNVFVEQIQNTAGMGTIMISSIMENTKPDFVSANKIYEPFSGPIGTALGLIAILMMALLGITMALDIAYIVLPMFQMFIDGGGDGSGGGAGPMGGGAGGGEGKAKIVSRAAVNAVKACSNQGGAQGQQGQGNKMAIAIYLKYRWIELVILGVCLLYLVSGNIYSFVGQVLDLGSGFLGF